MPDTATNYRMLHTMIRVKDLDKSLGFYTGPLGMKCLRKREVPEGLLAAVKGARAVRIKHFTPDPTYQPDPLPAVRAPHEAAFCLERLAALGQEDVDQRAVLLADRALLDEYRLHQSSPGLNGGTPAATCTIRA